jgi:hypothetical protein
MHWWLPNDEGYSPIIRSIRKFVAERTSPATDVPREDLREMKQIFSSLNLDGPSANEDEIQADARDSAQMNAGPSQGQSFDGNERSWYNPQQ